MNSVICKINDIKEYRIERDVLNEKKNRILSPREMDKSEMYYIDKQIKNICNSDSDQINTAYKHIHYFIFISAFIYSPRVFAGEPLERGKRNIMAKILGVSPSRVSHAFNLANNWYNIYRDFQTSVDFIYSTIMNEINHEKIKES